MKKNLVLVLGLVFLLYPIASCDPEDELNSLKISESPAIINTENRIAPEGQVYDKAQIDAASCDEIESTPLYGGKDIEVGLVHLSNSDEFVFITYDLTNTSWSLQETHLYIGPEQDIPYTKAGNPKIGNFPYHAQQDDTNKKEFSYAIPIGEFEDCMVIIAHAVVQKDDEPEREETAFAFDSNNELPGSRWGWYMDYCLHECEDGAENGDEEDHNDQDSANNQENTGNEPANGFDLDCLESYAFHFADKKDAHCFLSSGFDQWGWSNQVFYNPLMNYVTGYVLNFPLLASAYQCDIRNSLEVGYITVRITGGDGRFTAELDVHVTDQTYDLQAFDMYVGTEKYPLDNSMNQTVLPEFYNYHESLNGTRRLTLHNITWPSNAYFIARGILCPAN